MVNCTATVDKKTDVLDHGHRGSTAPTSTALYAGPAYLAAPVRAWQQEAALEGVITGDLHVHTTAGLQTATTVTVADHKLAGTYEVLASSASGNGWRLTLGRRPHGSQ